MSKYLLDILAAKDSDSFTERLTIQLNANNIMSFTIWRIDNSTICNPIVSTAGIKEGILDIYDLGYVGETLSTNETTLFLPDIHLPSYVAVFCSVGGAITLAITIHEQMKSPAWLIDAAPYIAQRYNELLADERRFDIFVDYQKKIDFVKDSGEILKMLTVDDVIIRALDVFTETFQAEAGCALKGEFFAGIGIGQDDLGHAVSIADISITDFLTTHTDTLFITTGLSSKKFNIRNIFIIQESNSAAVFILFNIAGTLIPDKEMSALITHIVSLAIENALYHEKETALKVEQAEMSQTVEIIKRFVHRETAFNHDNVQGCSLNYPARTTGGDFATIRGNDKEMFACIADVCGKGYAAATLTVMLATIIDTSLENYTELDSLANTVNEYMLDKGFDARFITGFFCRYNFERKVLQYTNCGHEPTFLFRNGEVQELHSRNFPLGIMPENYIMEEIAMQHGDLLFIYSDGLLEYATHAELQKKVLSMKDMPITEMVNKLYTDLVLDPLTQIDDFTCAAIKF